MKKYDQIAESEEFNELKRSKSWFIWPVTILFFFYYLTLPLMAGYGKSIMSIFVVGNFTFGYLFGLSFYFVAWILALVYVLKARKFDEKVEVIIQKYN